MYTCVVVLAMMDQFDKAKLYRTNTVGTQYDYRSIMHYGKTSI